MAGLAPIGYEQLDRPPLLLPDEPGCEPSTSAADSSDSSRKADDGYIYHKLTKLDTLAGLAIRYHVTVSDIKRANGILSDNAMFAREHIKIPTGSIPMSEEAQVLLARLMSGYGRDASLNAKERKAPGTVSITQLPGSPTASRSSNFGSEAVDDDPGTPYSRRSDKSSSEPGDVELMERSIDGATLGYGSDRVRRRTKNDSSSSGGQYFSSSGSRHAQSPLGTQHLSHAAEAAVGWLSNAAAGAAAAAQAALPAAASGLTGSCLPPTARRSCNNVPYVEAGSSTWDQLAQAISQGGNSLVQKIKRAASQPALGGGLHASGFADVADAVLRVPPRSPVLRGSSSSSRRDDPSSIDLLSRGTGMLPPRKDTKGD